LVEKLQEIRDALDDDAVFNVVGEVLPSNQIERLLRDFYAGKLSANDLEARLEVEVREEDFLRNDRVAELMANALRYFDGQRYELFAWCVMPNHVHVVFGPYADWTLHKILHS
jgi:hypothetical protein